MARAEAPRERIGEMLVALGLITRVQLDDALVAQRSSRLPIGKQLVVLGSVSEVRLTQVLSNQLSVPWVSIERVEFPAELLARIPGDVADQCSVLPIYVRNVRGRGATLYVAMDDPTDEDALKRIADTVRMPVRPMIAPPSEIRRAIDHRYFGAANTNSGLGDEGTGLRSNPARGARQYSPPGDPNEKGDKADKPKADRAEKPEKADKPRATAAIPPPKPKKPPPPPGPAAGHAKPEGVVQIEQYETPSSPPGAAGRTLTLLDGTQIKLPSTRHQGGNVDVRAVRHLVKAIKTARNDLGSDDPLRWHDIVQAVLDSLEIRGVRLTRTEIADAWLKNKAKREQPKAQ
jgi:type IV pilus assembly protein PilB